MLLHVTLRDRAGRIKIAVLPEVQNFSAYDNFLHDKFQGLGTRIKPCLISHSIYLFIYIT